MRLLMELVERVRALLFRGREEREMEEELRFHLEMETEKNVAAGMTPAEARRRARLAFGGAEGLREEVRDERGVRPLEDLGRDLRYAARTLGRSPGFTLVAVGTLALGIGASTVMFTLVHSVLLEPLPHTDPDQLVAVWEVSPRSGNDTNVVSGANVAAWRSQAETFAAFEAFADRALNLSGEGEPEEVQVRMATAGALAMLGSQAHLGGVTVPEGEEQAYAVLSHSLWQRRYGGDPSVLESGVTINDNPYPVLGVLPPRFSALGGQPELWLLNAIQPQDGRGRFLQVVGRLKPDVTLEAARGEMATIAARLAAEYPEYNADWGVNLVPLAEQVTGQARPALLLLFGAVGLLLAIACANVAHLFLARAAARRKEMALRGTLGASRRRLLAQSLTEAMVVAGSAGLLGVLLAFGGVEAVVRLLPADLALPRLDEIAVDRRVLAFALGVSGLVGLVFGALPALAAAAVDLGATLRDESRGATTGRTRLRSALVVAEVALALVLLTGAGLLARSFHTLLQVDSGVRAEQVLTLRMTLPGSRYPEPADVRRFMTELLPRLEALPGTRAVGTIGWLPFSGMKSATAFHREDRPVPEPQDASTADIRVVAGGYFEAMGVPLVRGRTFDASDTPEAPIRFLVNEALARRHFPGEDPVGKRLGYWWGPGEPVSGEIVGVVGNVREMGLDQEPSAAIYRAHAQEPWGLINVLLRTEADLGSVAQVAPAAVRELDPLLPVGGVRPLAAVLADTVARERASMLVLAGFAAASLLLVVIGLYGVVSYSVAQRSREIGVRLALGAERSQVLGLVVRQGMVLAGAGLLLGLAAALALGRLLTGLLYQVRPTDPPTLVAVSLLLAATALAASLLPALRAARVDPAVTLGREG